METLQQFVPMLLIFVAMYFLMIRPQMTKAKREKTFQENLKVGMKIVTTSGLHGRIFALEDNAVIVETLSGKLKFELAAISRELTLSKYPEGKEEKK